MKTIFTLLLVSMTMVGYGQYTAIDELFDRYAGQDGYTTVIVNADLFKLISQMDPEDKDLQKLTGQITGVKILALEGHEISGAVNFYDELENEINAQDFKELMVVKEKDQDVKILVKENNGLINEFLLIAGGNDNALIHITGNIDLNSLSGLSTSMNMEELALLRHLEEK